MCANHNASVIYPRHVLVIKHWSVCVTEAGTMNQVWCGKQVILKMLYFIVTSYIYEIQTYLKEPNWIDSLKS